MPDWYNPQYLNRYSYVRNNPLRYTDPTGHAETDGNGGTPVTGCYASGACQQVINPPASTGGDQEPAGPGDDNKDKGGGGQKDQSGSKDDGTPATVASYGGLVGAFDNFWGHGWDMVFEWNTNEIGFFEWDTGSPNGFVTPQASVSGQRAYVWGMDRIEDYEGMFDVTGGSLSVFTGSVFSSEDRTVGGIEAGMTGGVPEAGLFSMSVDYSLKWKVVMPQIVMAFFPTMPAMRWGKTFPFSP